MPTYSGTSVSSAARAGMGTLIETLRGMTDAGTADYTIGATTYWSDDAVQMVLDRHMDYIDHVGIVPVPKL